MSSDPPNHILNASDVVGFVEGIAGMVCGAWQLHGNEYINPAASLFLFFFTNPLTSISKNKAWRTNGCRHQKPQMHHAMSASRPPPLSSFQKI
jgi:hypothetical protein